MVNIKYCPDYSIDKSGKCYSHKKSKTIELVGCLDKDGYRMFGLRRKGDKKKWFKAHRLVAEAFIENSLGHPQIDHIDGDKLNNNVTNLRWCTNFENNNFNNQAFAKKTTKHIGIRKTTEDNYVARVTIDGERTHLGTFKTEREAIDAREKAISIRHTK